MRRLCGVAVTALALVAIPVMAYAQGAAATTKKAATTTTQKAAAPKALKAMGTISALASDSVTVKGKTESWTFTVDKDTVVVAKGASHKMAALKADGKPSMVTDFVKVNDNVTVTYHDMGATKHAAEIRVTPPPVK
jgi:hypothetical protein